MATRSVITRRLERLEGLTALNAEPLVINVVFVNSAKERVSGFQVTVPMGKQVAGEDICGP